MTPAITEFQGRYRFLSNFWPAPLTYNGVRYPTSEHAYQAARCAHPEHAALVRFARIPGEAKRLARSYPEVPGWADVKLDVMLEVLRAKFREPGLAAQLLATGNAKLVEGNTWGDDFWGVYRGRGRNHLGRLLMQVRAELRAGPGHPGEDDEDHLPHFGVAPTGHRRSR